MKNIRDEPEPPNCQCNDCKNMCSNPCIPTPQEAEHLIEMFGAKKFCLFNASDYDYTTREGTVQLLRPANPGMNEGSEYVRGRDSRMGCVFHVDGLCTLHTIKSVGGLRLKPLEGKLASCSEKYFGRKIGERIIATWDSDKGREVVAAWQAML